VRIGVITTSYPRFAGDPAGHFVASHVAAMRALGHDVDVIAAGDGPDRIPSSLFYRGGAPDALESGGLSRLVAGASFTARLAARVARRSRTWDRAFAHWLAPSALVALAAVPRGVPITAIAHGGDVHTLARFRLLAATLALCNRRGVELVFVSNALRELAAQHGDVARAIVQPMGIDVMRFVALRREPQQPPIVLVLSRLVPIKGVDVAIDAMAHVRTPARLVIAGDGPERARLERRGDAQFLGELDTTARDELLRRASVVVIPSRVLANGRSEGMPVVALEALATGVPVVASAVGGLVDLAEIRTVPPEDPIALARAIDAALTTSGDVACRLVAIAHLDWTMVARRLLA
jgi:glycosyltransferase involved in cell wall biosynthesis